MGNTYNYVHQSFVIVIAYCIDTDPCAACDENAECDKDAEKPEEVCTCKEGFTGDGKTCSGSGIKYC